jgi:hypothetical protein
MAVRAVFAVLAVLEPPLVQEVSLYSHGGDPLYDIVDLRGEERGEGGRRGRKGQ